MTKRDVSLLLFLSVIALIWITSLIQEKPSACPAPKDLESMEVYQFLSAAIHEDTTPADAIEAFAQMCEMPVDCLDDQILFEYRYSEYSGNFVIHLARQFQFSDSAEYVQLHLDLTFPVNESRAFPRACNWYDTGSTDIRKLLCESEGFHAVESLAPNYAGVTIDWTW